MEQEQLQEQQEEQLQEEVEEDEEQEQLQEQQEELQEEVEEDEEQQQQQAHQLPPKQQLERLREEHLELLKRVGKNLLDTVNHEQTIRGDALLLKMEEIFATCHELCTGFAIADANAQQALETLRDNFDRALKKKTTAMFFYNYEFQRVFDMYDTSIKQRRAQLENIVGGNVVNPAAANGGGARIGANGNRHGRRHGRRN